MTETHENSPFEDPPPPEYYADATGKGDVHIPGSGTIGIVLLLASLTVLFIASTLAFVIVRVQIVSNPQSGGMWPPPGSPAIPHSLWLSTVVILATSATIQVALHAIRRDLEKKLLLYLRVTFVLGVLFLVLQGMNWWEFYRALPAGMRFSGPYLGGFYVLTGLHAAHVIGGLIPLAVVIWRAQKGRYSRNFHPGVRYVTLYWHFLDIIWILLFLVIWL